MMELLIGVGIGAAMLWLWSLEYRATRFLVILVFGALAMGAGASLNQANQGPAAMAAAKSLPPCSPAELKDADPFTRLMCER